MAKLGNGRLSQFGRKGFKKNNDIDDWAAWFTYSKDE